MADPKPNPCRSAACRDKRGGVMPIVETVHNSIAVVRCPSCKRSRFGDGRADAIAEWNAMKTSASTLVSRWPWVLAAAILLAAFIGGAING